MGTYNDFSQLKKLKPAEKPAPKPAEPAQPVDRTLAGATDSADYFSALLGPREIKKEKKPAPAATQGVPALRTTVVTPATVARVREERAEAQRQALEAAAARREAALKEELEAQTAACESLATDLAAVKDELAEVQAAARQAAQNWEAERARLQSELAAAQAQLKDALRTSLSTSVLLDKPVGLAEKFAGEIHEHVLETVKDAYRSAEAAGRDRRARILEAILAANPMSGELERRRAEVKQIVKEAGASLDDAAIADLEKLGFRYISGNKHHKLEWAGIRFPLSKTPSDYRSCLNSAAEINNRVF